MKRILSIILAMILVISMLSACTAPEKNTPQNTQPGTQSSVEPNAQPKETELTTPSGPVRGLQADGVSVFKGIPYAKTPVRFAPPEDVEPWTETLDCTNFSPIFPQASKLKAADPNMNVSEDCLTANIWTNAANSDAKMPVYVWIHGGAFTTGSGIDPIYDGTAYAKQDIVMVTINYRLNVGGFMASQETFSQYGTTGNWGLLDQIKALEWIQKNIAAFGGDPNRVTIGGESAGSYSVSGLIQSPLAKGLFQSAIMESGSMLGVPGNSQYARGDLQRSIEVGKRLMFTYGAKDDAAGLSKMREVEYGTLASISYMNPDFTDITAYMMLPVFDGYVMAENPYEALKKGDFNKVNLLWGYNADEGSLFVPQETDQSKYELLATKVYGYDNLQKILEKFPVDEQNQPYQRAREVLAYGMFSTVMKPYGDALSAAGMKVYAYRFDYAPEELKKSNMGAMHSSEIQYALGTLPENATTEQKAVSDEMFSRWVNFIKTGDPNSGDTPSDIVWEPYNAESCNMIIFDKDVFTSEMPERSTMAFMEKLIFGDGTSKGAFFTE